MLMSNYLIEIIKVCINETKKKDHFVALCFHIALI